MNNITTTENIIRNETGPKGPIHVPSTENSTLRKGLHVKVWENPKNPVGVPLGTGVLTKCNDVKVYHGNPGFENWNVKFDNAEQSSPHIVHARDVIG